ncbi:MAG TPA: hypothetical protein PKM88_15280, partial [bacterium]|nr:hypothetical protein [bacterium]
MRIVLSTLLVLLLAAAANAEAGLTVGTVQRGKLSFSVPTVSYACPVDRTGVLLLRVNGLAPGAQVRLTVEHVNGRIVARGGPEWTGKAVGVNAAAGETYAVRLTLLGGAATGFSLSSVWSGDNSQLFLDQPLVRDFPAQEDKLTYAVTAEQDGYLDVQLTGPACDLDLIMRFPDGEELSSKGQRADESLFVKVEANTTYLLTVEKYDAHGLARIPFTLTAWQVRLGGGIGGELPRTLIVDDRPRYFSLRGEPGRWLRLTAAGTDSADVDVAVYRDGERLVDSLQQGMDELLVLGLTAGSEYLGKVSRGDNGFQPVTVTLGATQAETLADAQALAAGGTATGEFTADRRQQLFCTQADRPGVIMAQLNGDEVGTLDLDLVMSRRDGSVAYSRSSAGLETVVANLAAGEPAYIVPALYNRDTGCA